MDVFFLAEEYVSSQLIIYFASWLVGKTLNEGIRVSNKKKSGEMVAGNRIWKKCYMDLPTYKRTRAFQKVLPRCYARGWDDSSKMCALQVQDSEFGPQCFIHWIHYTQQHPIVNLVSFNPTWSNITGSSLRPPEHCLRGTHPPKVIYICKDKYF